MYNGVMGRTQIYLGDDELELLDRVARTTGASRSELIRRAVRSTFGEKTKPESTDWLGLIELGALEAAGMGADGRQGVERLRSPVKGPCEIKAR
jgi:predicted transcriptional regulator